FNINRLEDYHRFKNLWQNKKPPLNTGISFIEIWSYFFFRLKLEEAKWLYEKLPLGVKVIIYK
ncbi:MAG: L,D-transpeptidase, partial [Actinobacteria bacterium]|nr:L,D-transpeptidase [Actinomycetota bacterium]